jgi:type IX secretion system PorP/SprF family membrane protein
MKKIIKILFCSITILWSVNAYTQSDINMSTHWYNRANYNPASIARTDYIYLFSNARSQWLNVKGAPRTLTIQASGYNNRIRSAFGLSINADNIGVIHTLNPMFTYAYRISKSTEWNLTMGLSAGVFIRSIDGSLFESEIPIDPILSYNMDKTTRPDANFGIEFQSSHYILGISSTHLFSISKPSYQFISTNNRYGYAIYKNNELDIFNFNAGIQLVNRYNIYDLEVNTNIRFKRLTGLNSNFREIFEVGLSYHTSRQMTILFGINVSQNLKVAYAYDQSFINGYNKNSSHEIMLEYRIPFNAATSCTQCEKQQNWHQ